MVWFVLHIKLSPGHVSDFVFSQNYWPVPERVYEAVPFLHGVELPLVFVGIMTFILIMSSVTMVLAVEAGHRMDRKAVEKWMLWTILGGIAFLSCQAWEWMHFIHGSEAGSAVAEGTTLFRGQSRAQPIWSSGFCRVLLFHHRLSRLPRI